MPTGADQKKPGGMVADKVLFLIDRQNPKRRSCFTFWVKLVADKPFMSTLSKARQSSIL
jgi:hypothetical protein